MPELVDLAFAFGLPPRLAVEYFRAKGYAITWNWAAMEAEAHARAFTVAKAMRVDVLQTIRQALDRAIAEGTTLAEFQRTLRPRLEALGWWGKQVMERPDGTAQLVQTGSPRRLETIYRTNLQSAYMAGRYREFWDNREARPYWMYVAVMDQRTRPAHAALHGKIFRFDDPIWEISWPPCGFNCRCRARALSARDMERRGLHLSESGADLTRWQEVDPRTGEVIERVSYKGAGMDRAFSPDRGFGRNQATDWTSPFVKPEAPMPVPVSASVVDRSAALPPSVVGREMLLPAGLADEDYARRFLQQFGADIGEPAVFVDVTGEPIPISDRLFRDADGEWKIKKRGREVGILLDAMAIKEPDEIWARFERMGRDGHWEYRRRYLRSFQLDDFQFAIAVWEWGSSGWEEVTAFFGDPTDGPRRRQNYFEGQRRGALMYRRKD